MGYVACVCGGIGVQVLAGCIGARLGECVGVCNGWDRRCLTRRLSGLADNVAQ